MDFSDIRRLLPKETTKPAKADDGRNDLCFVKQKNICNALKIEQLIAVTHCKKTRNQVTNSKLF